MSTRSTVWYSDDPDIHVFWELLDDCMYLEHHKGAFTMTLKLPKELADVITKGLKP